MQYCSLQHRTLLLSAVPSTTGCCFFLWLHPFIFSGLNSPLISSSILGTYRPGEFIFLPFHTVNRVLKARILKWFAITFSSGPRFVRTLHHDLFILFFVWACTFWVLGRHKQFGQLQSTLCLLTLFLVSHLILTHRRKIFSSFSSYSVANNFAKVISASLFLLLEKFSESSNRHVWLLPHKKSTCFLLQIN